MTKRTRTLCLLSTSSRLLHDVIATSFARPVYLIVLFHTIYVSLVSYAHSTKRVYDGMNNICFLYSI